MAVKLYNLSPYPDATLLPVLTSAMRLAGAKGQVVVKVTRGGSRVGSHAHSCAFVYEWFLRGRGGRKADGKLKMRPIATCGGYVVMQPLEVRRYWNERIPCDSVPTGFALRSQSAPDGLAMARRFFETAVHEFAHIVQFQSRTFLTGSPAKFAQRSESSGRRSAWSQRPEEIDAVNRTDAALEKLRKQPQRYSRIQEEIIGLAMEMEQLSGDAS